MNYPHDVSPTWLPKHELSKGNAGHAKEDGKNHEASTLHKKTESGRNSLPQGRPYQLVIQYQRVWPENTHTSNIIKLIFRNIFVYVCNSHWWKEAIHLKESKEGYLGGTGRGNVYIISKIRETIKCIIYKIFSKNFPRPTRGLGRGPKTQGPSWTLSPVCSRVWVRCDFLPVKRRE